MNFTTFTIKKNDWRKIYVEQPMQMIELKLNMIIFYIW